MIGHRGGDVVKMLQNTLLYLLETYFVKNL